jgi:MOSC domain-containing protein YiiM
MAVEPRVHQINVNPKGGARKHPVPQARLLTDNVEGDYQANKKYHGGPERAVCLFSLERIEQLNAEGHPIKPGMSGENLTLVGVDWDTILPGTTLRIGEATIEITRYTLPCAKIAACFSDLNFRRMEQELHPGFSRVYGRILQEGLVRLGDAVHVD